MYEKKKKFPLHGIVSMVPTYSQRGTFLVNWKWSKCSNIRIWGDKWIPKPSTYMAHSIPSFLPSDATVGELIDNQTGWSNQKLQASLLIEEQKMAINTISISSTNQPDRQI
jgi:hypothetical protein